LVPCNPSRKEALPELRYRTVGSSFQAECAQKLPDFGSQDAQ